MLATLYCYIIIIISQMALGRSFIMHHVMTAVNLAQYNGARAWINSIDFYLQLSFRQGIHKHALFDLSFKIKDL